MKKTILDNIEKTSDSKSSQDNQSFNLTDSNNNIIGNNNVITQNSTIEYKFDDSAQKSGRKIIGHRTVGQKIATENMTPKEYNHYMCAKFNIPILKGWDGIERHSYIPNYEPNKSQEDFETKEEFLSKFNIKTNKSAPDGVEKRQQNRRANKKDTRKIKINRRHKSRRESDITNNAVYISTIIILLIIIIAWVGFSVNNHFNGSL